MNAVTQNKNVFKHWYENIHNVEYRSPNDNEKKWREKIGFSLAEPQKEKLSVRLPLKKSKERIKLQLKKHALSYTEAAYRFFLSNQPISNKPTKSISDAPESANEENDSDNDKKIEKFNNILLRRLHEFGDQVDKYALECDLTKKKNYNSFISKYFRPFIKDLCDLVITEKLVPHSLSDLNSPINVSSVAKELQAYKNEADRCREKHTIQSDIQYKKYKKFKNSAEGKNKIKAYTYTMVLTSEPLYPRFTPAQRKAYKSSENSSDSLGYEEIKQRPLSAVDRCGTGKSTGVAYFYRDSISIFNSSKKLMSTHSSIRHAVIQPVDVTDKKKRHRLAVESAKQLLTFVNKEARNKYQNLWGAFSIHIEIEEPEDDLLLYPPILEQSLLSPVVSGIPIDKWISYKDNNKTFLDENRAALAEVAEEMDCQLLMSNYAINRVRALSNNPRKDANNLATKKYLFNFFEKICDAFTKVNVSVPESKPQSFLGGLWSGISSKISGLFRTRKISLEGLMRALGNRQKKSEFTKQLKNRIFTGENSSARARCFIRSIHALSLYKKLWASKKTCPKELNPSLMMAALEEIICDGFGIQTMGGCKSSKDRRSTQLMMKAALIQFFDESGRMPDFKNSRDVNRLATLFGTIWNSNHYQAVNGENIYGGEGILDGDGPLALFNKVGLGRPFHPMIPQVFQNTIGKSKFELSNVIAKTIKKVATKMKGDYSVDTYKRMERLEQKSLIPSIANIKKELLNIPKQTLSSYSVVQKKEENSVSLERAIVQDLRGLSDVDVIDVSAAIPEASKKSESTSKKRSSSVEPSFSRNRQKAIKGGKYNKKVVSLSSSSFFSKLLKPLFGSGKNRKAEDMDQKKKVLQSPGRSTIPRLTARISCLALFFISYLQLFVDTLSM